MKNINNFKKIAISDVDGTIVKGSLVLNHACDLHEQGIIDFGNLTDEWRINPKKEILITKLAETYREKIIGKNEEDLDVDGYINRIVSHSENFYSTLKRLIDFRDDGNKVVLISGSPNFLVDNFAQRFDFDSAASDYSVDEFGRFTGDCVGMFSGTAKRDYLKTFGIEKYKDVIAFGDTRSDAPLFESAHYSVLVEPNDETHMEFSSKVNEIIFE